jgi:hypothetical protein
VLDHALFGSASTVSTTGVDLWGGGTSKPMDFGAGLIVIPTHFVAAHSQALKRLDLRLQVSLDGAAWVDADPATGTPWYGCNLDVPNQYRFIDIVFVFNKTISDQQYAKIQWKTDAGTVSLQPVTVDGWASTVRMMKFPTW